jgi:hypothetical protein
VLPTVPPPAAVKPKAPPATPPAKTRPAAGATATIRVSTQPAGAIVSIDNVRQSQPTNATYHVKPGAHTLVFEKPGYYPQDMPVADLKSGEKRSASASLKPVPGFGTAGPAVEGTLEIHVVPSSRIFVNDAMVRSDASGATLRLPAGSYTIRAVNGTYGSQEWRRELKAGAPVKIDYDFRGRSATP